MGTTFSIYSILTARDVLRSVLIFRSLCLQLLLHFTACHISDLFTSLIYLNGSLRLA